MHGNQRKENGFKMLETCKNGYHHKPDEVHYQCVARVMHGKKGGSHKA